MFHLRRLVNTMAINRAKKLYQINLTNVGIAHSSSTTTKLMEFFDDPKNWGSKEVKCGRAWKLEELRLKSNQDLHKLWYILLKERNMLLTMEYECGQEGELFPSPERLDKCQLSMKNLEDVVKERNRAYFQLETGESGMREGAFTISPVGYRYWRDFKEHFMPPHLNTAWLRKFNRQFKRFPTHFEKAIKEQLDDKTRFGRKKVIRYIEGVIKRHPSTSLEELEERYPDFDIRGIAKRMSDTDYTNYHLYESPPKSN